MDLVTPLGDYARQNILVDSCVPEWVKALLESDATEWLAPMAAKMYREFNFDGSWTTSKSRWPTRGEIVAGTRHRYGTSDGIEAALEGLLVHHDIFLWVTKNRRGQPSTYFGFTPYLARMSTARVADYDLRTGLAVDPDKLAWYKVRRGELL